jgi:hypothetical protein
MNRLPLHLSSNIVELMTMAASLLWRIRLLQLLRLEGSYGVFARLTRRHILSGHFHSLFESLPSLLSLSIDDFSFP